MKISFSSQPIDKIIAELIVLMHYEDELPFKNLLGILDWRINGRLSRFIQSQKYSGKAKELLLIPSEFRFAASEILILGLGKRQDFDETHISQVLDYFLETVARKKTKQVCFSLTQILPTEFQWRNAVRLLLSKVMEHGSIQEIILREPVEFIRDAKKRQMSFTPNVNVEFL